MDHADPSKIHAWVYAYMFSWIIKVLCSVYAKSMSDSYDIYARFKENLLMDLCMDYVGFTQGLCADIFTDVCMGVCADQAGYMQHL